MRITAAGRTLTVGELREALAGLPTDQAAAVWSVLLSLALGVVAGTALVALAGLVGVLVGTLVYALALAGRALL
jgi:hypothetical protein